MFYVNDRRVTCVSCEVRCWSPWDLVCLGVSLDCVTLCLCDRTEISAYSSVGLSVSAAMDVCARSCARLRWSVRALERGCVQDFAQSQR